MILASQITYLQAILLGLVQGVTELFPISSLGHSVILPQLLGWDIHQNDDYFITFLVATHLATATVLFVFFRRDWARILKGLGRSLRDRGVAPDDPDAKLGWLLVIGTIPAGLLGLLLEHALRGVFASAQSASVFLIANGVMLFGAEALRRRAPADAISDDDTRIATQTSYRQAFAVGAAQAAALIPGFSRSGAAMGGGLLVGLTHRDAARFAFLLATPIIGAAALLKLPELAGVHGDGIRGQALVASLAAAGSAWASIRFLMRYFETRTLIPFAIWSVAFGVVCSLYFLAT